jgi:hypothetical protein
MAELLALVAALAWTGLLAAALVERRAARDGVAPPPWAPAVPLGVAALVALTLGAAPTPDDDRALVGFIVVAWTLPLALARAAPLVAGPASPGTSARPALAALAALGVGLALARAPLAVLRADRNVDEANYAAIAWFARDSGQGLFARPQGFRLHNALWLVGEPWSPVVPDVVTSLAVGATAALLGLAVLRATGDRRAALLTAPLYALGVLRFEGLTSSGELWANLALAGWLALRVGSPASAGRRALAGACLGLAMLAKEHAAPVLLLEPALTAVELRLRSLDARAALRGLAAAAAGWWGPVAPYLLGLALHGELGAHLDLWVHGAAGAGKPFEEGAPATLDLQFTALVVLGRTLPLVLSPVTLLGLVGLRRAVAPGGASLGPFALVALAGLGLACVGLRFFEHYFQFLLPGLAALGALRLVEAKDDLARPGLRRWASALLLLVVLVAAQREARLLLQHPGFAAGHGPDPRRVPRLERVGRRVAALAPEGTPIFVWGWRPELYLTARRAPASRCTSNDLLMVPARRWLSDLEARPPSVVVVCGLEGLAPEDEDPFALERHPELRAWLVARGYREVEQVEGYVLLTR